jgi:hypothetical protein
LFLFLSVVMNNRTTFSEYPTQRGDTPLALGPMMQSQSTAFIIAGSFPLWMRDAGHKQSPPISCVRQGCSAVPMLSATISNDSDHT